MKIPHAWNGSEWTCLQCHETHTDPCSCRCCGLQCCTDDPEMARTLRSMGDALRERYGELRDHVAEAPERRVRRPASGAAGRRPRPTG